MTAVPPKLHGWTRSDVLLLGLAVAGAILYVVLMPAQHPDAAASYALGGAAAREAADAFLAESGYALDGYDARVSLRRDPDLLKALQADLGRPATGQLLKDPERNVDVPAYYWRVRYTALDEEERDNNLPPYTLNVTVQGRVWDFERTRLPVSGPPPGPPPSPRRFTAQQRVDRRALQATIASPTPNTEEREKVDLSVFSDSLLVSALFFDPGDSLWQAEPALVKPFDGRDAFVRLAELQDQDVSVRFGPETAVTLARYHLQRAVWAAGDFRVDSMWVLPERNNQLAHIRFMRSQPLHGQQVRADVTLSAAGALFELDVDFLEPDDSFSVRAGSGQEGIDFGTEGEAKSQIPGIVATVAEVVLYGVLVLVLIVAFFKRFASRLIDGRAILVDLAVIGGITALLIGLMRDLNFSEDVDSVGLQLLVRVVASSVGGGAVGLFVLILSGATDSLARAAWSKKLHASSLVRLGAFRNIFVGAALLRGVALALILLGLVAGLLFFFPDAIIDLESEFVYGQTWQPMIWLSALSGMQSYLILILLLLAVGTFAYGFRPRAWLVVGAIIVAMVLGQGAAIELQPVGYTWILSALWGTALGLAFWRYDFLTCFVGYFVAYLLWMLSEGWLVEGSPAILDIWLAGLFVGGLVVAGTRGVISGETRRAAAEYVPTYISELKNRERLKSELDIARQVQESFLPRRMPNMPGLDIAAMCLAAHEVGGDYYDFVHIGRGKLAVVVGDVSGKGTQAAFYMTLVKGILQTLSREGLGPADVMRRLNVLFCENVPRGTFISMIYGIFDVEARTFTFARAGHNPVILKRSPSQEPDLIQPTGLAIGLVTGATFDTTIEERTIDLRIGDVLVFYTDGFSEAMNALKDQYGDDRLARKVSDVGQRSASEILHAVAEDVHHFVEAAGRHDDMTMIVVKLDRSAVYAAQSSGQQQVPAEA